MRPQSGLHVFLCELLPLSTYVAPKLAMFKTPKKRFQPPHARVQCPCCSTASIYVRSWGFAAPAVPGVCSASGGAVGVRKFCTNDLTRGGGS